MKTFVLLIRNHPALSLAFAAMLVIVAAVNMIASGRCLKTSAAPYGIISLELAWDKEHADRIVQQWNKGYCNGDVISFRKQATIDPSSRIIEKAKVNIMLDYIFLAAYTLFFVVCILLLDPRHDYSAEVNEVSQVMLACSAGAGFLDAVENGFMYLYLVEETNLSFLFALPATIKFLFVLVVVLFIIVGFLRSIASRR